MDYESVGEKDINGDAGDHDIMGDAGTNDINGDAGDNDISGGADDNDINGDAGTDDISGDADDNDINGDDGTDDINGNVGTNGVNKNAGHEKVDGEDGEAGNTEIIDIDMDQEPGQTGNTTEDENEHDDKFGESVKHVEDNMPFICICTKTTTNTNVATQTNLQNTIQQPESSKRIPLRPERQLMKQKTLLAKNEHTIRKMEHSIEVKTTQIDRLRKQNNELKTELNLRWRELTTSRANHNNDKRKLNESEARLQESIRTNKWCTKNKHDFLNLHIDPPMVLRLTFRQTLSNNHLLVQTTRHDMADYGKLCNLLNLQLIMGKHDIEVFIKRVIKNIGTKHTVMTVEYERKTIQNILVVNPIEKYRYTTNSKLVLTKNNQNSIVMDRTFEFPHIINMVQPRQLNDQTEKYKHRSKTVNHINELNGTDDRTEPAFF